MDVGSGVRAAASANRRMAAGGTAVSALLVAVVAACGGAPPDGNGVNNGGPGNPVPTLRPVTGELTEFLPSEVGGETLEVRGGSGAEGLELLPQADATALEEQLERLNLTTDRLTVAVAGDLEAADDESGLALVAVRVPGVLFTPGSGPQVTLVKNLLGISGPTRTGRATQGGKTTTTIRQTSGDVAQTTYVYGPTEVVFIARGPEELVDEAFRDIPEHP